MKFKSKRESSSKLLAKIKSLFIKISQKSLCFKIIAIVLVLIFGVIIGSVVWYQVGLRPVDSSDTKLTLVTIENGSSTSSIAETLENSGVIRSKNAFYLYVRLSGKTNNLQAGTYRLSKSETTPEIVSHLVKGDIDQFKITFYPGATLVKGANSTSKDYSVKTALKNAGYSESEIKTALAKQYSSPIFADKPASADLEGYIYGDTYSFNTGASVEDVLQATFDRFYEVVKDNNLTSKFSKHGLNLYEGITLASIIQREASNATDQKQVAQVFYLRLKEDIALGSDVTYQYIADKTGVTRDPSIDSPYNTRIYTGLTPGPISVPGLSALEAVADPADGDYLYFLSGDDGKMHYAYTEAEHEANITEYCKIKCSTS